MAALRPFTDVYCHGGHSVGVGESVFGHHSSADQQSYCILGKGHPTCRLEDISEQMGHASPLARGTPHDSFRIFDRGVNRLAGPRELIWIVGPATSQRASHSGLSGGSRHALGIGGFQRRLFIFRGVAQTRGRVRYLFMGRCNDHEVVIARICFRCKAASRKPDRLSTLGHWPGRLLLMHVPGPFLSK